MKTTIAQGLLEGDRIRGHIAFRGIPFAKPPLGPLRFAAPQPPEPWAGVRTCCAFGPSSLQGRGFAPGVLAEGAQSEDCLYLNVSTPSVDARRRPVMVWLHGGAFTVGAASTPLYDGGLLAELFDVVVVTTNYRLGALGYLALGEHGESWGASDNRGLLDQLAALRWVRDNIEHFGGDPDNVTLFGESAGATSVKLLLTMPSAAGLFHRAVAQSGAGPYRLASVERALENTRALLWHLDLPIGKCERLRDVPVEQLMRAQSQLEADADSWPHFFPVLDGVALSDQPADALARSEGPLVPLINGTNRDEWNLFAVQDGTRWNEPQELTQAIAVLKKKLSPAAAEAAPQLLETYRQSRTGAGLAHDTPALVRAILGDYRFRIPNVRFAEQYAIRQQQTFMYMFSYASPALRGALGACHALEIPFVFGTLDAPGQERFAGKGQAATDLSRTMMANWTSFARLGIPTCQGQAWPAFDVTRRMTMLFDRVSTPASAPFDAERRAWDGLL